MLQLASQPAPGKGPSVLIIVHEVAWQTAGATLLPEAGEASAARGALRNLVVADYLREAFLGAGTTVGSCAILSRVELPGFIIKKEFCEKQTDAVS